VSENKNTTNPQPPLDSRSLSGDFLSGTVWSIAIRWTSKFLGIISLAICARILHPEDYGLVSMAMVVVGFSNILVQFGLDTSLIRTVNPSAALYNSAWSMRIIQGSIISLIVIAATPVAYYFYKDARVPPIMIAVGLAGLVGCLENIYVVNFRKQLNFRTDFIYSVIPRFTSFLSSVVSVVLLRTYWGLVIGICVAELARTITSYIIIKQRPRWALSEWKGLFSFSGWYMFRGLGEFLSYEFDRFILGSLGGPRVTGIFNVAKEVAALPATEIVIPIGRALSPTLALLTAQPARLSAAIEKSITGTLIIAAPAALGFALISNEFILLLFGAQWLDAIPILAVLSMSAIVSGFRDTSANVFVITGNIRVTAILAWIQAILMLSLIYPFYKIGGLVGVAWLYVIVNFAISLIYAFFLKRLQLISGNSLWIGISRPIASSIVMYQVVNIISIGIGNLPTLPAMIVKIVLGALVYSVTLYGLWAAMGKRDSSERILIDICKSKITSLLRRR
jgi:O-antigen/teichoic acid export membrane protein